MQGKPGLLFGERPGAARPHDWIGRGSALGMSRIRRSGDRGRELDDGIGLLEGGGSTMRSIRLRTPGDAARPAVKRIVRKAFKLGKG